MIDTLQPALEQAALRPVGPPPGYGEGIALLFLAALVLAVAPTILMSVIGSVAGAVMPNTSIARGFLIGAGVGVLDTIACFLSILLLVLAESADLFDVHSTHILVGVAAVVVLGVAATVWLIRRLRKPAERSAR